MLGGRGSGVEPDMATNQLEHTIGGITLGGRPHGTSVWVVLALRVIAGIAFVQNGLGKVLGGFDAQGYLLGAEASPISGFLAWIAATPPALEAVNVLVAWGELLIGLGLLVGFLTRLAAISGVLMMVLFYLGNWSIATEGTLVTEPLLYLLVFLALATFGAGRILGLDRIVENHEVGDETLIERHPRLGTLLG